VIIILALAGLVLAAIAFLASVVSGFSAPGWVLPTAVLCVAAVVVLGAGIGAGIAAKLRR